jgi:organic radical activating enzyme
MTKQISAPGAAHPTPAAVDPDERSIRPDANIDALHFRSPEDENRVVVEWLLATICNHRCSYCPDELHDGQRGWLPWSVVEPFCRRLVGHYRDRDMTFLLTGGEPTLYPDLLPLADLIHHLGGAVAILSNGSRRLVWWEQAVTRLDEVLLSYHCEFAHRPRFMELTTFLASRVALQVNLVMVPDRFDECLAVGHEIERRAPNAVVHYKPLMEDWRRMHGYAPHHWEQLVTANAAAPDRTRFPGGSVLKGDLVARRTDGNVHAVTPIELIIKGENHWLGWDCSIGIDSLFIRGHEVYRSACGVGGRLGSIYDRDITFPSAAISCTLQSCNCIAGIKSAKHAPAPRGAP